MQKKTLPMRNDLLKLYYNNHPEKKSCERVIREGQAPHKSVYGFPVYRERRTFIRKIRRLF